MNKARRKEISGIVSDIGLVKRKMTSLSESLEKEPLFDWIYEELACIYDAIDSVLIDEQMYLENVPENLHGSERYEAAEEAESNLCDAVAEVEIAQQILTDGDDDAIQKIAEEFDEIASYLREAINS